MSITAEVIRYLSYDALKQANEFAVKNDLNRAIHPDRIDTLSKDHVYPIAMSIPTSYTSDSDFLRCKVVLSNEVVTFKDEEGGEVFDSDSAWLDVPFDFFMKQTQTVNVSSD